MVQSDPTRVVLLHGLWMPRASMRWWASRLREAGYAPTLFGYPTVSGGPVQAVPQLARLLREAPCHVVAHSLGGLIAVHALETHHDLPVRRVLCLGSPLCGSTAAKVIARWPLAAASLGRSAGLLRDGCAPWPGPADLGCIAGTLPLGFGQLFRQLPGHNDGTVAVSETRLAGMADHATVHTSHSGLLFSHEALALGLRFLARGSFEAADGASAARPVVTSGAAPGQREE